MLSSMVTEHPDPLTDSPPSFTPFSYMSLTILGLSSFWQYVAKGAVIVLAVLLDKWRQQHNSAN